MGLVPFWWNKPLDELRAATFNARAETVMTTPFFRQPFERSRCLIPVSGYYEWQDTPSGKQPWYFTRRNGVASLAVAGLWDEWKNRETGELLNSCAMVTTEPNDLVAEVRDRMPVLLDEKDFKPWLNCDAGVELLEPAPNDLLQKWPVSERVNSSLADDSDVTLVDCIEFPDPALPLAGRLLF